MSEPSGNELDALRPLVDREYEDAEQALAALALAGFIRRWAHREARIARLYEENNRLKRKILDNEQRSRDRMHGVVDVMWAVRTDDG